MPRKRVPKTEQETPAMRRLRAEIIEELNMPLRGPLTPEEERREAESDARFWRRVEKRIEKGATEIEAILAEIEREDRKPAEKIAPVVTAPPALRSSAAPAASRPTPPTAALSAPAPAATEKPDATPKRRGRLPAGLAGYVLIDGQES